MSDKAFSRLILTSVIGVLVCIACLCSTTFAWFTDSAPSAKNEIKMASECLLSIAVSQNGTPLSDIEGGAELSAGVEYVVTLSLPRGSSSGYCVITTADGTKYKSDYLVAHDNATPTTSTFILTVEETQVVGFASHWGIYSSESDVVNGVLALP